MSVFPDSPNTSVSLSIGYYQNCITIIGITEDVHGTLKEARKKKLENFRLKRVNKIFISVGRWW